MGGTEPEKPPLSNLANPILRGRGTGKAGAGQGTEDGGPGCPCSMSQICVLSSKGLSSLIFLGIFGAQGQGLGRVRHNATFSCTPLLPDVPEALGSFPNEVPGRTLPN